MYFERLGAWRWRKGADSAEQTFCVHLSLMLLDGKSSRIGNHTGVHGLSILNDGSPLKHFLASSLFNMQSSSILLPFGMSCFKEIMLYQIVKIRKRAGQVTQAVSGFVLGSTTISEFMHLYHLASMSCVRYLLMSSWMWWTLLWSWPG